MTHHDNNDQNLADLLTVRGRATAVTKPGKNE